MRNKKQLFTETEHTIFVAYVNFQLVTSNTRST